MSSRSILLCSASPRRRMLLENLGHSVVVAPVDANEAEQPGESPERYLERVVHHKLTMALAAHRERLERDHDALLVADTIVIADGGTGPHILQKPLDEADGARMLRMLGSRAHDVITRFAIVGAGGSTHEESVGARVFFRAIEPDEVDAYVAFGEGRDKAGGYAIQGRAAAFVKRIEGSFGAVVGLPSCEVEVALRALPAR